MSQVHGDELLSWAAEMSDGNMSDGGSVEVEGGPTLVVYHRLCDRSVIALADMSDHATIGLDK